MYFISNIFLRIRGGSKSSGTNAIFFALVQELIDRPSYINEQLLEHDAYISCLELKKVNVAHDAMHNNYLYNHTAYYHVLQQVIAFLVYTALATCETSQVLLAGVSGGFPGVLPFRPTYRLARLDMSEIILKGTLN